MSYHLFISKPLSIPRTYHHIKILQLCFGEHVTEIKIQVFMVASENGGSWPNFINGCNSFPLLGLRHVHAHGNHH